MVVWVPGDAPNLETTARSRLLLASNCSWIEGEELPFLIIGPHLSRWLVHHNGGSGSTSTSVLSGSFDLNRVVAAMKWQWFHIRHRNRLTGSIKIHARIKSAQQVFAHMKFFTERLNGIFIGEPPQFRCLLEPMRNPLVKRSSDVGLGNRIRLQHRLG